MCRSLQRRLYRTLPPRRPEARRTRTAQLSLRADPEEFSESLFVHAAAIIAHGEPFGFKINMHLRGIRIVGIRDEFPQEFQAFAVELLPDRDEVAFLEGDADGVGSGGHRFSMVRRCRKDDKKKIREIAFTIIAQSEIPPPTTDPKTPATAVPRCPHPSCAVLFPDSR